MSVSNDGSLLAYSTDTNGSERYRIVVKDLGTGEILKDEIEDTTGSAVWAADDTSFFYTVVDANWRPWQVRRHVLGEPVKRDAVVYEETDPGFFVNVSSTTSREYIVVATRDPVTSEERLIPASDPDSGPVLVSPRRVGHEYSVDHQGDRFVIRTNDTHKNARLATSPADDPTESSWMPLLEASDSHYIRAVDAFQDFIAVEERVGGLDHIRLIDRAGNSTYATFPEPAYAVRIGTNPEFETGTLRLEYTSMVTPITVFDYHVDADELEVRRIQQIPSGYDSSEYVTERVWVAARDGARVHIRHRTRSRGGGDDLGYHWYEAGKLDKRTNTFNDFVDVARGLIELGYGTEGRVAISGASAGGQLMGAVVNQAPHLWGAVIAHVPFVDVLNTMVDDTLPLTPIEWPEWGNPIKDKAAFELIRSYSPYEQLKPRDYPPGTRHRGPERSQGDLLGTCQVRGKTAGIED